MEISSPTSPSFVKNLSKSSTTNYVAYKGYDLSAQGDLNSFPDGDSVQEWALPAMLWANGNALINGHDDGTLDPASTTTRVQAASILMRFDLNVAEN